MYFLSHPLPALNLRIRLHDPQPKVILVGMIGPLVLLVVDVEPDDPTVGVLTRHDPALDAGECPAPAYGVGVEPHAPLLEIRPLAHAPRDGIPAALRPRLLGRVPHLDDEAGGRVREHTREEPVIRREVVVLWQGCEGEDARVEVHGFGEGLRGKFEMVDAVEGSRHARCRRMFRHCGNKSVKCYAR